VTLSPVFRSQRAVGVLRSEALWHPLQDAAAAQREAVQRVQHDLAHVIDRRFVDEARCQAVDGDGEVPLAFIQQFFFLIFFRAVLQSIGFQRAALGFFSELNFCIAGTITAADNIFDDQEKALLPLSIGSGPRFGSILELLTFQRLIERVFERGMRMGVITATDAAEIHRDVLSQMAVIGTLEGSEERGVGDFLPVADMIEQVHRVRGGTLFELAFIAPRRLSSGHLREITGQVMGAIARLGTAFQMVDDLTDLEFDVVRGRQNLLAAQIWHHGAPDERRALAAIRESGRMPRRAVETLFAESARALLVRAQLEAHRSLEVLERLGFWFPAALSHELVHAIVGLDGQTMMDALATSGKAG
jgi:hypothetical protein